MTGEQAARIAGILDIPKADVEKVFSVQSPQMQAFLLQTEEERIINRRKPVPIEAQRLKEDGSVDLNVREITPEEAVAYQAFRMRRGAWIEEVRTQYLMAKAKEGKIHPSLMDKIETGHVTPRLEIKERAERAYMRGSTLNYIKDKFKELMKHLIQPTHAEVVAEAMRKAQNEK